jgi:hypothetical protein
MKENNGARIQTHATLSEFFHLSGKYLMMLYMCTRLHILILSGRHLKKV